MIFFTRQVVHHELGSHRRQLEGAQGQGPRKQWGKLTDDDFDVIKASGKN
jgi:hypothetical protein